MSEDTGFAFRGCTLDAIQDLHWWNNTETCSGNGCNVWNVQHQLCIQCDSKVHKKCANFENVYEYAKACTGAPYSYRDRGCFTMKHCKLSFV